MSGSLNLAQLPPASPTLYVISGSVASVGGGSSGGGGTVDLAAEQAAAAAQSTANQALSDVTDGTFLAAKLAGLTTAQLAALKLALGITGSTNTGGTGTGGSTATSGQTVSAAPVTIGGTPLTIGGTPITFTGAIA